MFVVALCAVQNKTATYESDGRVYFVSRSKLLVPVHKGILNNTEAIARLAAKGHPAACGNKNCT